MKTRAALTREIEELTKAWEDAYDELEIAQEDHRDAEDALREAEEELRSLLAQHTDAELDAMEEAEATKLDPRQIPLPIA